MPEILSGRPLGPARGPELEGGQWGNRLSASIDSYQANLFGVAEALGSEAAGRLREANEDAANYRREMARRQGAVMSFRDVDGVGSALNYVGGLAVDSLPYLGEAAVGGLVGRGLAVGARTAASVGSDLGIASAVRGGRAATAAAATGGAVAASYPSAVGDVLSAQREQSGQIDLMSAAALGVPYAGLNALGLEGMIARGALPRAAASQLDQVGGIRGGVSRAGVTGARVGLVEGSTETGQEVLNQIGRNVVDPNAGYLGEDALDRYAESFVGGAALGGSVAAGAGGWRRSAEYQAQQNSTQDLMAPPAPPELPPGPSDFTELANPVPPTLPQGPDDGRFGGFGLPDPGADPAVNPYADWWRTTPTPAGAQTAPIRRYDPARDAMVDVVDDETGRVLRHDMNPAFPYDVLEPDTGSVMYGANIPYDTRASGESNRSGVVTANPAEAFAAMDPGAIEARRQIMERMEKQRQAQEAQQRVASQVAEKNAAFAAAKQRAQAVLGANMKLGNKHVELFQQLEQQRDAGLLTEDDFINDAAQLSRNELGAVRKNIAARAPAAPAAAPQGTPSANQPNVAAPAAVAPAAPAGGSAQPVGGLGAVRPVAPGDTGVAAGGAIAAAPGTAEAAVVGQQPGQPGTGAVAAPAASQPAPAKSPADYLVERLEKAGIDLDKPITVKTGGGKSRTISRRQLIQDMASVTDPVDQVLADAVFSAAGGRVLSLAQMGELVGLKTGRDAMGKEAVRKRLGKYGITEDVLNQFAAAAVDTVSETEFVGADGAMDGVRIEDSLSDAAASGQILDDGTTKEQSVLERRASELLSLNRGKQDQATKNREAAQAALADEASAGATTPAAQAALERARALKIAEMTRVLGDAATMEDAARDWDDARSEGAPAFAELPLAAQADWALEHRALTRESNEWGPIESAQREQERDLDTQQAREQRAAFAAFLGSRGREALPQGGGVVSAGTDLAGARAADNRDGGQSAGQEGDPEAAVTEATKAQTAPRTAAVTVKKKRTVNRSAQDGDVVLEDSETRETPAAEMAARPYYQTAKQQLERLGLGDLLNWVTTWRTAPRTDVDGEKVADGWVHGNDRGQMTLTLNEGMREQQAAWVLRHEIGHIADMTPYGGAYSADPRLAPGGSIYDELETLAMGGGTWGKMLDYPLGYDEMSASEVAEELFAQLFAAYTSPVLGPQLRELAPESFAFMRGVARAIKAQSKPTGRPEVEVETRWRAAGQFVGRQGVPQQALQRRPGSAQADRGRQGGVNRSRGGAQAAEAEAAAGKQDLNNLPPPSAKLGGIKGMTESLVKDGLWRTRPGLLGWLSGEQLADIFKSMPGVGQFAKLSSRMAGRAMQVKAAGDALLTKWDTLRRKDAAAADRLDKLLSMSTEARLWPNLDFRHEKNQHVEDTPENRAAHAKLQEMWRQAGKPAQDLYNELMADTETRFQAKVAALRSSIVSAFYPAPDGDGKGLTKEEIDRAADAKAADWPKLISELATTKRRQKELRHLRDDLEEHDNQFRRMPGPYFPLMRFGKHIVVIKSAAYQEAEKALVQAEKALREAEGRATPDDTLTEEREALKDATARINELKASSADYRVDFFETIGEARQWREDSTAKLSGAYSVQQTIKDEYLKQVDAVSPTFMRRLEQKMSSAFEGEKGEQIRVAVREMYLQMLPEQHMMKAQLKRRNVAGASQDAQRTYAASVVRDAHGISRLEFQAPLRAALDELRFDRYNVDAKLIGAELAKRLEMNFKYEDHPTLTGLTNLTYLYRLGLSPSFLLTNLTQPWFVSAPIIAARHHFKTFGELRRATVAAATMMKGDYKQQDTVRFQIDPKRALKAGEITQDEAEMLQSMLDSGRIDITITQDLGAAAEGEKRTYLDKAVQFAGLPAQQIEVMNRTATALAAYRLERQMRGSELSGQALADAAYEYADRMVSETHLNYAAENRARHMHPNTWGGWGRVMWQFRTYQQGMIYLVMKNLAQATKGDKEAQRAVAYLSGTMLASAGVTGLPGIGALFFVAQGLYGAFEDDDEEKDLRQMMYAGMESVSPAFANLAMKGLPSLVGVDLSSKVGMGDLLAPVRFGPDHLNPKDQAVGYFGTVVGGASVGLLGDFWKAANHVADGDLAKAAQSALPKVLADPVRTYREQTEGVTDSRGRVLITPEERDFMDAVAKAAGIPTVEDARRTERRQALFEARENRDTVRSRLLSKFAQARLAGEPVNDVLEEIQAYNARHPDARITPANREAAVRGARTRSKELRDGVPVRKQDQGLAAELGI